MLLFILLTVWAVFLGKSNAGEPMEAWSPPMTPVSDEQMVHKTPGSFALVLLLLGCFAVYYFANWKALADVWWVR